MDDRPLDMERLQQAFLQMAKRGQDKLEEGNLRMRIKGVQAPAIDISGMGR